MAANNNNRKENHLAVVKLDSKLGIWTSRGRPVWADHGRSHRRLPLFPEGVLAEDEVGEVERQTCRLPDPHLQTRRDEGAL